MKSTRFEDRKILPSTEAFINEIFRHASFLPFTILHCEGGGMSLTPCGNRQSRMHTTSDTTLNGYFIPRKTCTFINMYQVLTFGMGIQKCLREDVARNEIFIFITTVLQQLKLEKCPEAELDLTPMYGLAMKPTPYQLQVETHST
ncbi:hypothetical protein EI555_020970, partial [Monodon monoceros]